MAKEKKVMNLYLVGFSPKNEIKLYTKWLETNSLADMNRHIMKTPYKEDICFPLLSSSDKETLEETGKTVLLFSDLYYYLVDIEHKNNTAVLRHINIDTVLN
jgi:hypothetical protein